MPLLPPLVQPLPSEPAPPKSVPPAVAPTGVPAVATGPAANPAAEPETLVHEAQQAWVRKHYALAIDRARSALVLSPDLPLAYQIITLCSCALLKPDEAQQAAIHLDPAKRTLVRALCEKDGITLAPE